MLVSRHHQGPESMRAQVDELLTADPGRATVLLTVLHGLATAGSAAGTTPFLLAVSDGATPVAAAVVAPPRPLNLLIDPASDVDAVGTLIAAEVVDAPVRPAMVEGPAADCAAVQRAWQRSGGGPEIRPHMRMLRYRLTELVHPAAPPGRGRPADPTDASDLALLAQWRHDFSIAIGDLEPDAVDERLIRRSFRAGATMMLWCDPSDRPVAFAAHTPVVAGMARIGPVYTPAGHERQGYGSAVTAAAVRSAQQAGAREVVLFTDAAYPTSNRIYQRLGFAQVDEFAELALDWPASES